MIYMGLRAVRSSQREWEAQKFLKDKTFKNVSGQVDIQNY